MHSLLLISFFTLVNALVIPFRRHNKGLTPLIDRAVVSASSMPNTSTGGVLPLSTPTSSSSTLSSALAAPSSSSRKFVVAHHMVGNTFPYTVQDWADDMKLAHASGIDAFALNVGRDEFQKTQVANAYQGALESELDFKLFFSLDMSSLPCGTADNAEALRTWVLKYATHPNQFVYSDRAFVSTFSGEACNFGEGSVADGWKSHFVRHPDLDGKVLFVPSFFVDPETFSEFKDVMHGDFNWNSAWPVDLTTDSAKHLLHKAPSALLFKSPIPADTQDGIDSKLARFIGSTETDEKHLRGLSTLSTGLASRDATSEKLVYMASVSPWFFTHYGSDTFNKNFVYLGDHHLYARRWESLISSRDQVDIVEINTWNDYGESHYIAPVKGAEPGSEAWTTGMDHAGWLELTKYYATAFKTGAFPEVEKDQIFMWSRPHPTNAEAQNDSAGKPTNFELFEDAVWAVVLTTGPSSVTLSTSDTNSQTFDVPAGLSKLSISISPGDTMRGRISREGKTIVELQPESFVFQGSPATYNFNAFVASASAE